MSIETAGWVLLVFLLSMVLLLMYAVRTGEPLPSFDFSKLWVTGLVIVTAVVMFAGVKPLTDKIALESSVQTQALRLLLTFPLTPLIFWVLQRCVSHYFQERLEGKSIVQWVMHPEPEKPTTPESPINGENDLPSLEKEEEKRA